MNLTHTHPHTNRFRLIIAVLAVLFLTFGASSAAASEQWIHIKIDGGNDDEQVTVNLPLSLLSAAVAMIPDEVYDEAEIALDDLEMDWQELRDLWSQIKTSADATYVTVQSKDETIKVMKEAGYLVVTTAEQHNRRGTDIDVRFPLDVVDALFSGPGNRLDFAAALHALAAHGPDHLVSVRDGDETIRVWIDGHNEAD